MTTQCKEVLELLLLRGGSAKAYDLQDDDAYDTVRRKLRQADSGFVESDIEVKGVCGKRSTQAGRANRI